MIRTFRKLGAGYVFIVLIFVTVAAQGQSLPQPVLETFHAISSHPLYHYVDELASPRFEGRLTGTEGYNRAARWTIERMKSWGIEPGGADGSYLQHFPNPYTLVFDSSYVCLHLPVKGEEILKYYHYDDQFIPGSTSGSGEVTAEVVYAGYGITAPELGYDDYKGVDVRGKIVLIEREAPVSPDQPFEIFRQWRPYSFHQYKLLNAVKHGAKGMLYNYGPIGNPNNAYSEGFVYSHVGQEVVADIFAGTGRNHKEVVQKIRKELKPQSFVTGKVVTIKNVTEHHPEGTAANVLGKLTGSDPNLRDEVIVLGAHLDHLGKCPNLIPGANDNASGVAVVLGVAQALAKLHQIQPLKRSILFVLFGAEEQAVAGSKYFLKHPPIPLGNIKCFLNLDGVGCGDKIRAIAGKNFPNLFQFIMNANETLVHRVLRPSPFANVARPRLDAARFLWEGIPTLSFSVYGGVSYYHNTHDDISTITPEILEDLAKILFVSIQNMANRPELSFQKPIVLLNEEEKSL